MSPNLLTISMWYPYLIFTSHSGLQVKKLMKFKWVSIVTCREVDQAEWTNGIRVVWLGIHGIRLCDEGSGKIPCICLIGQIEISAQICNFLKNKLVSSDVEWHKLLDSYRIWCLNIYMIMITKTGFIKYYHHCIEVFVISKISSFGKFFQFVTLTLSCFELGSNMSWSNVWVGNHGAVWGILRTQAS